VAEAGAGLLLALDDGLLELGLQRRLEGAGLGQGVEQFADAVVALGALSRTSSFSFMVGWFGARGSRIQVCWSLP
jgi:hypothetical protein